MENELNGADVGRLHESIETVQREPAVAAFRFDIRGMLGVTDEVRRGFDGIRVTFDVKGDASEEELRDLVETAKARSPVFDMVTNATPVKVELRG